MNNPLSHAWERVRVRALMFCTSYDLCNVKTRNPSPSPASGRREDKLFHKG